MRFIKRCYEPLLRAAIRARVLVLGAAGGATVLALWLASTFGTSFLPSFNEGTFTIFLLAPPGTALGESDRLATEVEKQLAVIDGVSHVSRRTGRAERDEHAEPVSNSEIEVGLEARARTVPQSESASTSCSTRFPESQPWSGSPSSTG